MLTWFLKNTLKEKHILRAWKSSLKTSLGFLILKFFYLLRTGFLCSPHDFPKPSPHRLSPTHRVLWLLGSSSSLISHPPLP